MEKLKYFCEKINWRPKNKKLCNYNRYLIGITSLWLLIPFIYGILHLIEEKKENEEKEYNIIFILLILWIGLCCIISTLLGLHKLNSWIHILDIKCAEILFIILCIFFGLEINNEINHNNIDIKIKILFPLLVVIFYIGSVFFYNKNYNNLSTLSHLTFRFIGFWWCFTAVYSNILNYKIILIFSLAYFSHILLELDYIYKLYNFEHNFTSTYKVIYTRGCIKSILFILICFLFVKSNINYLKK